MVFSWYLENSINMSCLEEGKYLWHQKLPIHISSVQLCKSFECILYKHLYHSIRIFLSPHQHGFIEKRSTITNLAYFSQFVSKAIDTRKQVDATYLDFQKVLGQIDLLVLIDTLRYFGFWDSLLQLFQSSLFNRVQYVKYRNHKSHTFKPISDVPQGSNRRTFVIIDFYQRRSFSLVLSHLGALTRQMIV